MAKWLIPVAAWVVILAVGGVGFSVWTTQRGDSAGCDRQALARSLGDQIARADQSGAGQFQATVPAGCSEQDLSEAVAETTRSWHMMPGGMMMREARHTG